MDHVPLGSKLLVGYASVRSMLLNWLRKLDSRRRLSKTLERCTILLSPLRLDPNVDLYIAGYS